MGFSIYLSIFSRRVPSGEGREIDIHKWDFVRNYYVVPRILLYIQAYIVNSEITMFVYLLILHC